MVGDVLARAPGGAAGGVGRNPRVIMIFAPKGGVGKTMLSANLAAAAAAAGRNVGGLDYDSQESFANWGSDRRALMDAKPRVDVSLGSFAEWRDDLARQRERDIVVIDTPPGLDKSTQRPLREIGSVADLIIMPTDFFGGSTRYVVDFMAWWADRPSRAFFVLNKVMSGTSLTAEAREVLQSFGDVWEGSIPLRVDLGRAFALGYAAADNKRFPAHTEFATLWGYCDGRMRVPA